jgi:hypothetical protein
MFGMIKIIQATEKEIPIIEDILLDSVQWLDSIGQSLWRKEQIVWSRLSKDFDVSEFYIALIDGVPVACMAVADHSPTFSSEEPSLFICKLAIKRLVAGKNLSDVMISHAKSMCIDRGISALRLDCSGDRLKLRAIYERNNFICVDEKDFYISDKKFPVAFYRCEIHNTKHLYHYYEKGQPPFRSISALSFDKAEKILNNQREINENLVHPNIKWFLKWRYNIDKVIRKDFIAIGGKPIRSTPVYFTLGANAGVSTWFENPTYVKIPVDEFEIDTVSYTYGDVLAVFNPKLNTGEDYWGKVYHYDDILGIIEKYGYPKDPEYNGIKGINPKDKPLGDYLKYIEAHVWSDEILDKYRDHVNL